MKRTGLFYLLFIFSLMANAQVSNSQWLEILLRTDASPLLLGVLNQPETFRYQLIYTKIDRDRNNLPKFTNYCLNADDENYFYPASMVKMPTSLAALEKINVLKHLGIDKKPPMLTDSRHSSQTAVIDDNTSANGLTSIDPYLKKIFVVSDNDAYNRLYEFCGQQYLNEALWKKGYRN